MTVGYDELRLWEILHGNTVPNFGKVDSTFFEILNEYFFFINSLLCILETTQFSNTVYI